MSDEYEPLSTKGLSMDTLRSLVDAMHEEQFLNRHLIRTQREEIDKLNAERLSDPLTGLGNRRKFNSDFARLASRKNGFNIGLLFVDFDNLKPINDQGGHAAGDKALVSVANAILGSIRFTDSAFRISGDEFAVILLPERNGARFKKMTIEDVRSTAEHLLCEVRKTGNTVSIGCAVGSPQTPPDTLLAEADASMYTAKDRGRDQIAGGTGLVKTLSDDHGE